MAPRSPLRLTAIALPALLLAGCFDEPPQRPNVVFKDALEAGIEFQPFLNSNYEAFATDTRVKHAGDAAIRMEVLSNKFAGGAFVATPARDLSAYNALTFWARASRDVTLDNIGIANDNTGTSRYTTTVSNLPLTTEWARFVLPIPAPSRLTDEAGVLWLADGADGGAGYQLWLDEVEFAALDASAWNPQPAITAATVQLGAGDTYQVTGTKVTYTVDGAAVQTAVYPATFDYLSDDPDVATVTPGGLVTALATGTAHVSASCAGATAPQVVTVQVAAGLSPTAGPPTPTVDAANVVSLYSDAYPAHPVDNLGADWSNSGAGPRRSEVTLGGDHVLKYTDLVFVGIEFAGAKIIDASTLTHLHVDVWTKTGTVFKVKLVDFGADGVSNYPAAGDDKEHELTYNAGSSPALVTGQWVSLEIPLSSFTTLTSRAHLAQVVFSSSTATVFVDNVYFHR